MHEKEFCNCFDREILCLWQLSSTPGDAPVHFHAFCPARQEQEGRGFEFDTGVNRYFWLSSC